jgi:hypothetical protein
VSPKDPAEAAVDADLSSARFRAGVARRNWRVLRYEFPVLVVAVAAVETDGSRAEYAFHFELGGYPAMAPQAAIWDLGAETVLAVNRRPKGSPRIAAAFQSWGPPDTVYRPWERISGAHGDWVRRYPDLAWHAKRDLAFALEDLHGILTSNAVASCAGSAA